jgi:hypothetical protein
MKLRKLRVTLDLNIPESTTIADFESKLYSLPVIRDLKIQTEDLGTFERTKPNPLVRKLNMRKRIVRKALKPLSSHYKKCDLTGGTYSDSIDVSVNSGSGYRDFVVEFNEPELQLRYGPERWPKLNIADPQLFDKLTLQLKEWFGA